MLLLQPLIKAESDPSGAISLEQTLNRIYIIFVSDNVVGYKMKKTGTGEQLCIVQKCGGIRRARIPQSGTMQ